MSIASPKEHPAEAAGEKASRVRQRQRLIEACISALYAYGPSRTTIEKVVSIANLSPGIVNFYFDSKAAMMVAALEHLAGEFEREVLDPVILAKDTPVRALELLVDLYLDPEIASPRKVSVWFAFWGEASSRKEYFDICGKRDAAFAALVHELIERLILESGEAHLDADGVALGLIGGLDQLWQDFAFQVEANIDRADAKRRCKGFLRSVFPRQFGREPLASEARPRQGLPPAPRTTPYADQARLAVERDRLFLADWQFVGHESELARSGEYVTADLAGERALVVRDSAGRLRAFRNACRHRPHALTEERHGRFTRAIHCSVDGLVYGYDGAARGGAPADLAPLAVGSIGGLVFLRLAEEARVPALPSLTMLSEAGLEEMRCEGPPVDVAVAADWKIAVEQVLDRSFPERAEARAEGLAAARGIALEEADGCLIWRATLDRDVAGGTWAARRYASLAVQLADDRGQAPPTWLRLLVYPNQIIEIRPDGATVLQPVPVDVGSCLVRRYDYARARDGRALRTLGWLARRLTAGWLAADVAAARSTQRGLQSRFAAEEPTSQRPAVAAFRRWLAGRLGDADQA